MSSISALPSSIERKTKNMIPTQIYSGCFSMEAASKEVVHVSNSSHLHFLNLLFYKTTMIMLKMVKYNCIYI